MDMHNCTKQQAQQLLAINMFGFLLVSAVVQFRLGLPNLSHPIKTTKYSSVYASKLNVVGSVESFEEVYTLVPSGRRINEQSFQESVTNNTCKRSQIRSNT